MSVGSVRDIGDIAKTEAEQRIIEMVAAGGEAALAPSPTRTIEPSASMAQQQHLQQQQVKRKPENTISTESMTGARKRDKPTEQIKNTQSKLSISEVMDVDVNEPTQSNEEQPEKGVSELSSSTLPDVIEGQIKVDEAVPPKNKTTKDTVIEEVSPNALQKTLTSEPKTAKPFAKTKTTDLSEVSQPTTQSDERVTDEATPKPPTERRKSRILEAAERFEAASAPVEKPKKPFVVPTKKEVERKTSAPQPPTALTTEKRAAPPKPSVNLPQQSSDKTLNDIRQMKSEIESINSSSADVDLMKSDSKSSNLSLDEARRSMENSIALLNQAKLESSNEVDQLCAKTENVAVSSKQDDGERQKKLKHAREIIGNAIPRLSGMGIRKPPVPFGANGRSISGSVVPSSTLGANNVNRHISTPPVDPRLNERESPFSSFNSRPMGTPEQAVIDEEEQAKGSAEVTLKSATLPRRKIGRPDVEPQQQYHLTYNPVFASRGVSAEPQQQPLNKPKEHYIPIQRVGYVANTSASQRSVLSRQSTNDSDTSDTQTASTTTMGTQPSSLQTSNSSQPIKKSPREYIIPIAVEGGGFVTPRAGSIEPSESNHSTSTAFSRFSARPRKIRSILNDSEDESVNSPFHRMQRHTSIGRDSDTEAAPATGFTYRRRSTRPFKKLQTEGNDSGSSGEEDDEDGFEILTAENLFSTLLSRVRALTNRLNVKDDPTSDFPSARFLNNFRQTHSPFFQHDPFASKQYTYYSESVVTTKKKEIRLNSSGAWRHSMTRDLGTDIDSVFSPRTGATLSKGAKSRSSGEKSANVQPNEFNSTSSTETNNTNQNDNNLKQTANNETLDLADLDLSRLRLTKKDIETLSSITPSLPKHFQDQLLAQLPPNQARKLSRTLSMQATGRAPCVFKRSASSGREALESEPPNSAPVILPTSAANASNQLEEDISLNEPTSLLSFDRNSVLRRSVSRGRDQSFHRRSTSAIRSEFPSRLSYTGDLRTDYNGTKLGDSITNRYRLTDYTPSIKPECYSKLPLPTSSSSPQKSPSNETFDSSIRRRSSQREYSRYSRPELYGSNSSLNAFDDTSLTKTRREKERETQSVLREIRERSRDRSRTSSARIEPQPREPENQSNAENSTQKDQRRKSSIPNIRITVDKQNDRLHHVRNKSTERCCDDEPANVIEKNAPNDKRINMTNTRSSTHSTAINNEDQSQKQTASEFTDEILSELLRRSKEYGNEISKTDDKKTESGTLKKSKSKSKAKDVKKVQIKQKSLDLVDKSTTETAKDSKTDNIESVTVTLPLKSKIARRMSYPCKEASAIAVDKNSANDAFELNGSAVKTKKNEVKLPAPETKVITTSKLTPPKEVTLKLKKTNASSTAPTGNTRNAITAVMEKFIEKSTERLSPGKSIVSSKSKADAGEASPTKTKKKIKVVKKLTQNDQTSTETKEPSPKKNERSNETSPVKEVKSPEKKLKSGFLYSIGQKFEKMRENSKNKEKEKKLAKTNDTPAATPVDVDVKAPIEKEQKADIETVQTIIIPRIVKDSHGETVQKEEITILQIEPSSINPNSIPKVEQRKSRIDAVIRNLRERSVPHTNRAENRESELGTESGLLKRAVSVEDMSNGGPSCHKSNVNKVLGLFRRIEKEQQLQKQQAISNASGESSSKERPKSGDFVSKMKKGRPYTGAKSDTIVTLTDHLERQYLSERANESLSKVAASNSKIPFLRPLSSAIKREAQTNNCQTITNGTKESTPISGLEERTRSAEGKLSNPSNDTVKIQVPSTSLNETNNVISDKERIRNNRKGLVLDLSTEQYNDHFKKVTNDYSNNNNNISNNSHFNSNGKSYGSQCNGSSENHVNNNFTGNGNYYPYYGHTHSHSHSHSHSFPHGHSHGHSDRNGTLTPSCDMSASYSSDNQSVRDDCESTSTFFSPTEEQELCFDDWSGSTDDHSLHPKHLKYASTRNQSEQKHSHSQTTSSSIDPTPSVDSESVIDRIKRRSYYCRFNEKKPKRTSSIVGQTAQRDYYRDMANKTKPRFTDYFSSNSNGYRADGEGSFSRAGSKSPTPMNVPSSSRANTPSCYSMIDENDKYRTQPQYQHSFQHRQRSQTPSRSIKSPFDDGTQTKSNEYLNLRSTLTSPPASKYYSNPIPSTLPSTDYQHNGNRPYSLRNSAYDSLPPSIYGTYNPKRRLSTSYLAPAIAAANSSSPYSSSTKDQLSASCYATLGRNKPRAYDHRSLTLLDTSSGSGSLSPSSLLSKRYGASNPTTDHSYTHSHYRPGHDYGHFNSRSSLRSPPIIQSSTSNV